MTIFIAFQICVLLHIIPIALLGHYWGVVVREFSFGIGNPPLIQRGVVSLRWLLIGGFVRFKNTLDEDIPDAELNEALDQRSLLEQLLISLVGCAALLLCAIVLLGWQQAIAACFALPAQLLIVAFSPFDKAQQMLDGVAVFVQTSTFWGVLGCMAAKLCMFNMLPFPGLNGWAVLRIIGIQCQLASLWPAAATKVLVSIWCALLLVWLIAVLGYVF